MERSLEWSYTCEQLRGEQLPSLCVLASGAEACVSVGRRGEQQGRGIQGAGSVVRGWCERMGTAAAAGSDLNLIVAGAVFDVLAFIALLVTALFMAFRAMNAEPGVRKFYYM